MIQLKTGSVTETETKRKVAAEGVKDVSRTARPAPLQRYLGVVHTINLNSISEYRHVFSGPHLSPSVPWAPVQEFWLHPLKCHKVHPFSFEHHSIFSLNNARRRSPQNNPVASYALLASRSCSATSVQPRMCAPFFPDSLLRSFNSEYMTLPCFLLIAAPVVSRNITRHPTRTFDQITETFYHSSWLRASTLCEAASHINQL